MAGCGALQGDPLRIERVPAKSVGIAASVRRMEPGLRMVAAVSGLFESAPVPGEVESGYDDARPGWTVDGSHQFSQDETDILIRAELVQHGGPTEVMAEHDIRVGVLGEPRMIEYTDAYETAQRGRTRRARASRQLGGIDSDPHVRRMAFRAWGNRDRGHGDINEIVERYRIKLWLLPWDDHAESSRRGYREMNWSTPGGRVDLNRRTGRTTLGILTTLAKCEAWGIVRVMLHDTWFAKNHVYPEMLDVARRLGVSFAIGVADAERRRGIGPHIAHTDHHELETRRDARDPLIPGVMAYSNDW